MGLGKIPSFLGMIPSSFGNYRFSHADKVGADKVVFWYPICRHHLGHLGCAGGASEPDDCKEGGVNRSRKS